MDSGSAMHLHGNRLKSGVTQAACGDTVDPTVASWDTSDVDCRGCLESAVYEQMAQYRVSKAE